MAAPVYSTAVLGAGLIGAGWAALFALRGWPVVVVDPAPDAGERVTAMIERARPVLDRLGLLAGQPATPTVIPTPGPTLRDVVLVQEALPEQPALKREALLALESWIGADALIASSSSGLMPSQLQAGLRHPERLLIAHPCNPPWLMPVVELVGGGATGPATLDRAEALYRALGREPVRLRREVPGHLLNRLQAALWREAVYLVAEGYATVADVDTAVTRGLGARWACCGPHEIFHLAGADRGLAGFLEQLGPAVEDWWRDLGEPTLDAATRDALIAGMDQAAAGRGVTALAERLDALMPKVLEALRD
ncbi:3-hydroxyacyl-CoA dehydrogenase NAD-binding domain-containing protein [Alloalcanivorax sp. C16-2]|uniref:3-hydroxyacyl-CoA dehydrogenase NAD-binding domain-containing protein n=1 Tax=Alloalcanivorax TaxID=3020832 RepID=UPI0019316826|nr:3-hydroxyacyl-CoA dehydrogenase NAD-binding domain-containing protein [Alloalcanivorax marinus]MBL7249371.1 hydrogenase [Alloalcanivorax marinus]